MYVFVAIDYRDMKVYADIKEQPKLDRSREELSEPEQVIYESLMNVDYVKKFLDFLSLEEQKGQDNFRREHVTLFKVIYNDYSVMDTVKIVILAVFLF